MPAGPRGPPAGRASAGRDPSRRRRRPARRTPRGVACSSVIRSSGPNGRAAVRPRAVDAASRPSTGRATGRSARRAHPSRTRRRRPRPGAIASGSRASPPGLAPQPPGDRRVGADMDRLDRRGDPGPAEPCPVVGVEQLDVLETGHQRRPAAPRTPGHRASRRQARSPIEWTCVAIPASAARRAKAATSSGWVSQIPRSVPGGSGRPSSGLDRVEQGRRPRGKRPVGEELQPAEPGAAADRPERVTAPELGRRGGRELLGADRGVDPERQVVALIERAVRRDPQAQAVLEREGARDRGRRRPRAGPGRGPAGRSPPRRPPRRPAGRDRRRAAPPTRGGRPSARPSAIAPDDPARRIGRPLVDPGDRERPRGWPTARGGRGPRGRPRARVRPARGRLRSARRPSGRCASRGPGASASGSSAASWAAAIAARPSSSVAVAGQVDPVQRQSALGQVEVGVRQPWDRDLVGIELDPSRVGVGPRLEVDRRSGEGDPAIRDPDGVDPAEPAVARERGDPAAADQQVERHQRWSQKRSGSWIGNGSARSRCESVTVETGAEPERQGDPGLRTAEMAGQDARRLAPRSPRRRGMRSRCPPRRPGSGVARTTGSPSAIAASAAARSAGSVLPDPVAATTKPSAPAAWSAAIGVPSVATVAVTRKTRVAARVAATWRRGPRASRQHDLPATDVAEGSAIQAAERVEGGGVGLRDVIGCLDRPVQDDDRADVGGRDLGRRRHPDGIGQVPRPLVAGLARRAHRPGDDDRLRARRGAGRGRTPSPRSRRCPGRRLPHRCRRGPGRPRSRVEPRRGRRAGNGSRASARGRSGRGRRSRSGPGRWRGGPRHRGRGRCRRRRGRAACRSFPR